MLLYVVNWVCFSLDFRYSYSIFFFFFFLIYDSLSNFFNFISLLWYLFSLKTVYKAEREFWQYHPVETVACYICHEMDVFLLLLE